MSQRETLTVSISSAIGSFVLVKYFHFYGNSSQNPMVSEFPDFCQKIKDSKSSQVSESVLKSIFQ
jgi:hypothetical protein